MIAAVCQTLCLPSDLEGNMHRMDRALIQAHAAGARLACFPETAFLGWVNPDAHHRAHAIPGAWTDHLAERAREFSMFICAGLAEKSGADLYDSAVLVAPDGELILKHRKINTLTHLLTPPYTRGSLADIQVAETELGTVGKNICSDTNHAPVQEPIPSQKPDLLLVPYGWAAEPHQWPEHSEKLAEVVTNTALRVGCPVVGTDCVGIIGHGPWTGYTYGGRSVVSDAHGKILALAADREPDVMIVDIA